MINTLPPEVIEIVLGHMLVLSRRHFREKENVQYISFSAWNQIRYARDLRSLAHTCHYLESTVHSIIFRGLACFAPRRTDVQYEGEEDKYAAYLPQHTTMFREYFLPPSNSRFEKDSFLSYFSNTAVPQFCSVLNCTQIPQGALKHVQSLFLNFSYLKVPSQTWISTFFSGMTSLKDVMLKIDHDIEEDNEISNVTEALLAHENTICVHIYFGLPVIPPSGDPLGDLSRQLKDRILMERVLVEDFEAYFYDAHAWKNWSKLNIETLVIELGSPVNEYSIMFSDIIKDLKSLKRMKVAFPRFGRHYIKPSKSDIKAISTIISSTQQFSNLKEFSFNAQQRNELINVNWSLPKGIDTLAMPLGFFTLQRTFEGFDNITKLDLVCNYKFGDLKPPFRNLKVLTIDGELLDLTPVLKHFVACNTNLVKFVLYQGNFSQDINTISQIFSGFQEVEIHKTHSLDLMGALTCAPKLRRLKYRINYSDSFEEEYPLGRIIEALKDGILSEDLETLHIDIQPDARSSALFRDSGAHHTRSIISRFIPKDLATKVVKSVAPIDFPHSGSLMIDFKLLKKYLS